MELRSRKKGLSPGVWFDTEELTLSVTPERIQDMLDIVHTWLQKHTATLQELQSLVGKMSFVSSCVHASRVFISRILNWLRLIHGKRSAQPIPSFVKLDLLWWSLF